MNNQSKLVNKCLNSKTQLEKQNLYIKIGDLVQEISDLTNIQENKLKIKLNYIRNTFPIFPKNHLLKLYKNHPTSLIFQIYNGSTNLFVNTVLALNFSDNTADGQTLIDHSTLSFIDGLNLMTLKIDEKYIPDVMLKIDFQKLNENDNLETKAILNCLKKRKYMTEDEMNNLRPQNKQRSKEKVKLIK